MTTRKRVIERNLSKDYDTSCVLFGCSRDGHERGKERMTRIPLRGTRISKQKQTQDFPQVWTKKGLSKRKAKIIDFEASTTYNRSQTLDALS